MRHGYVDRLRCFEIEGCVVSACERTETYAGNTRFAFQCVVDFRVVRQTHASVRREFVQQARIETDRSIVTGHFDSAVIGAWRSGIQHSTLQLAVNPVDGRTEADG